MYTTLYSVHYTPLIVHCTLQTMRMLYILIYKGLRRM